jgi:hypothetical protein
MRLILSSSDKYKEFPPNCLQFRGLCLESIGAKELPSIAKAWNEVWNWYCYNINHWSHLAVKYTASKLPVNFWEIESTHAAYKVFGSIYAEVCFLIKQGHQLPNIELNKIKSIPNPEIAKEQLKQIKKKLGIRTI